MRYVISYDLISPGKDYQKLWDALSDIGAQRILLSQWAVRRTNTSAKNLRDYIWQFMDANDRLLVMDSESSDWAGINLMTKLSAL